MNRGIPKRYTIEKRQGHECPDAFFITFREVSWRSKKLRAFSGMHNVSYMVASKEAGEFIGERFEKLYDAIVERKNALVDEVEGDCEGRIFINEPKIISVLGSIQKYFMPLDEYDNQSFIGTSYSELVNVELSSPLEGMAYVKAFQVFKEYRNTGIHNIEVALLRLAIPWILRDGKILFLVETEEYAKELEQAVEKLAIELADELLETYIVKIEEVLAKLKLYGDGVEISLNFHPNAVFATHLVYSVSIPKVEYSFTNSVSYIGKTSMDYVVSLIEQRLKR